eukprot:scaffold5881_cov262-Alexandrium_tamarense.AAC.6
MSSEQADWKMEGDGGRGGRGGRRPYGGRGRGGRGGRGGGGPKTCYHCGQLSLWMMCTAPMCTDGQGEG